MLRLEVVGENQLRLVDEEVEGGKVRWSRHYSAPIAHARFHGEGLVLVQTNYFVTEFWDPTADRLVGPRVDETRFFGSQDASDAVLLSSFSAADRFLLSRSHLWIPPNLGIYAFTVWDPATGEALSDRRRVEDPTHAEFSEDGSSLLFGGFGEGDKVVLSEHLELVPPAGVRSLIPELAEALGGFRILQDGSLQVVEKDPWAVLEAARQASGVEEVQSTE